MPAVAIAPAVIATAASAAVTAAGAVYSGMQQKRAADYNAKMSEQNAKAIDVRLVRPFVASVSRIAPFLAHNVHLRLRVAWPRLAQRFSWQWRTHATWSAT